MIFRSSPTIVFFTEELIILQSICFKRFELYERLLCHKYLLPVNVRRCIFTFGQSQSPNTKAEAKCWIFQKFLSIYRLKPKPFKHLSKVTSMHWINGLGFILIFANPFLLKPCQILMANIITLFHPPPPLIKRNI